MSALHQAIQKASARFTPDAYIPVVAQDPDTGVFLCDDGYLGVCYLGDPVNGADDTTAEMLKGAFSLPLPEGSFVQLSLMAMPDIDLTISRYKDRRLSGLDRLRNTETRNAAQAYAERRAEFVSNSRWKSNIPAVGVKLLDRKLLICMKVPYKGSKPTEEDMVLIAEQGAKLAESLQAIGLYTTRVSADTYLRLAHRLTHPFREAKFDEPRDDEFLKEQVFEPGETFHVHKDSLELSDGVHAHMLSVGRWPKRNALSLMAYMIGDPMGANNQIKLPYHINMTMHYPAQFPKTTEVKRKAGFINYQAFGPMLRFVPKLAFKKQGMDVLIDAVEQGAMVVEASLTMTVYSENKDEGSNQISALRTYMQSFDFAMGEEKLILWPCFWNAFPLFPTSESIKNTFRFKTMAVEHAATFFPILGEWKGTSAGYHVDKGYGLLTQSRRGQMMAIDLFDSSTNMNGVVFAEAGAGKSFFTQSLVCEYLSMGAKVFVIDAGRSFYKLCRAFSGAFVEFNSASKINMNPFSTVTDIDDSVGLIQSIIEKMAAPETGLDDYRLSRVEEAIKAVWGNKGTSSTITDIADYMRESADSRIADVGNMLFRFTRMGSEGSWFDGAANLDLQEDLIVLELEELKNKKTLQQVVLMQLISAIQQQMYLNLDGRPKLLIIDEAWDLLDDPMVARFMEHAYRRFRKYGGSAIIITQSIADLYGTDSGRAIAANSAFKFILRQTAETIDQVQANKYLSLGEYGFQQLRTVHTIPNKYCEVMIYTGGAMGISRIIVDRFTQVLFSSSGRERSEILSALDNGVPVAKAIDDFIAAYG